MVYKRHPRGSGTFPRIFGSFVHDDHALELAQGVGDFQSLDRTGRRALHVHLPRRDPQLLREVTRRLLGH